MTSDTRHNTATSKSEVVVPVFDDAGKLIAVLDVDSSRLACFSDADAKGLAQVMAAAFARPRPATPPPRKIKHAH
jgi:putative methionine-R-sulfoxide reductase with GAF domain